MELQYKMYQKLILLYILLGVCRNHFVVEAIRTYDEAYVLQLREEVRQMFNHAYESYLKYAYPYDELRPLSCDGVDTWGSYSLTLIDALDTLAVMGNHTEFQRVVDILVKHANFDSNSINVSVFETNIRIIGGLLSAHLLSYRAGVKVEQGWPCNGPLLELAENVARKLVSAFDTNTGMPYGTVNLLYGVPQNETTVTCTAGVGTFVLEFSTLSRLTGDPLYEEIAMNALHALWNHRSSIGLVGNHVDIQTGRWTAHDAGIGAGVDSYFEYLAKGAIFLQKPELMHMFNEYKKVIDKYLKTDDWYMWASMTKGQLSLLVFQSLEAYWPGVLSLIGETSEGMKSLHNYHQVWKQYGFTPEFYNIPQGEASNHRESYPLRPELVESVMYLYRVTGDSYLLSVGEDILRSIQHSAVTQCGYATINDVRDHRKEDRMESFFLAETTKYLYLLFDKDNFIHNTGQYGTVINTPWGECILDAGGYIFNTEAHPIDSGALHCCSEHLQNQVQDTFLDFDPTVLRGEKLAEHRKRIADKKKEKIEMEAENLKNTFEESSSTTVSDSTNVQQEQSLADGAVTVVRLSTIESKENQKTSETLNLDKVTGFEGEVTEVTKPKDSVKEKYTSENLGDYRADKDHINSSDIMYSKVDGEVADSSIGEIKDPNSDTENISFSSILNHIFSLRVKREFAPQALIEKIRKEEKYPRNHTWSTQFHLLRCPAQPFLSRLTINGEFFDLT